MSNQTNTPDSTPAFDLFGVPDEDNLKEQLAKGTFQWTNKYTRILAIVFVLMGCLSAGAVYGHYEATKASSSGGLTAGNIASLRAAFGGGSGASGFGGASAGGFSAGGFGGGGFSRGTAGTVAKVSGNTVTITLTATPTTPIKVGDNVTVRGATAGAGGFGAAAGGLTGGTAAGAASGTGSSAGTPSGTPTGAGAGTASGTPRAGGAGGRFSNPAFTACLAKAGVTLTAGTRPNFQDPKVAAAIQSCATSLGLSAPGAGGGGFGSRSAGGSGSSGGSSAPAAPAAPAPAASPSN
jgi:hypothetical protein